MEPLKKTRNLNVSPITISTKKGENPSSLSPYKISNTTSPDKPTTNLPKIPLQDIDEMAKARVIQSNLVYIINLPAPTADEELLRSQEYFGQYGRIKKCVINKGTAYTNTPNGPSYGVHVTFSTDEEAAICIKACNGFELDGKKLTATYGTTKYCTYFLRGRACAKPDCLYLHKLAPDYDTLARDTMPQNRHIQPKHAKLDCLGIRILPPDGCYKLPIARVIRERAASESFTLTPVKLARPRIYSRDVEQDSSRFDFVEESEEDVPIMPDVINALRALASPCQDEVEVPTEHIEELMSPSSPDKWACDIIEVSPLPRELNGFDVDKVLVCTKKPRLNSFS
ncbi:unnamed protein product [Blepharisma stoltei]|uniref:RRM domain-containing protein n=1 Tax=Blepharisma stoltei TaxID=1481888 RepID=A0AAU9K9M1_9CILI|nr:unnamed protein product [Blepharisma stoltei]